VSAYFHTKEELFMTNEELNTALYQKMFSEQEYYRSWLLTQPPEEMLHHTYEYSIREDILLSLEYNNLSDAQCRAMLRSPTPLSDTFNAFEKRETDYMEDIWDTLEDRANRVLQLEKQKEPGAR
jgi:hypothetical protein